MASMWPPKKNAQFTLYFSLFKTDGTIIANPGTYTKKVSIDGGAVADITASVTEEDTTYGQLSLVLSASEMNGDAIWVYIKDDTSGCVPFTCTLYTAAATLDEIKTAIDAIDDYVDTEVAAIKAKTDNLPASPAATGDIPTSADIADKVLGRSIAGGADGGRTVKSALAALRNKVTISGGTMTVYDTDDSTSLWSAAVTTDAAAEPIITVDPS